MFVYLSPYMSITCLDVAGFAGYNSRAVSSKWMAWVSTRARRDMQNEHWNEQRTCGVCRMSCFWPGHPTVVSAQHGCLDGRHGGQHDGGGNTVGQHALRKPDQLAG